MGWWRRDSGEPEAETTRKRRGRSLTWERCEGCGEILPRSDIEVRWGVCPRCGHHHPISIARRISLLLDAESFAPLGDEMTSRDPLRFKDTRRYKDRLKSARKAVGLDEVLQTGRGRLEGRPVIAIFWVSGFLEGTVGEVAAARFALACEVAQSERCPLFSVGTPSGLRLQEGMNSLWGLAQMAAARRALAEAGLPFVSILTEVEERAVVGAVFMGDINLAEPSAAVFVARGLADRVVPRAELRGELAQILHLLATPSRGQGARK